MFWALLLAVVVPLGLDLYMPVPEDNPMTAMRIERGRRLFFDTRLSRDGTLSCASCHDPQRAFSDPRATSVGISGRPGRRHAPALVNRGYGQRFFWVGRVSSLEAQVLQPIEDPNELGASLITVALRVGLPPGEIARALSSFVRSILSGNSPFDRFLNGARDALTADQQRGMQIFRGKGNCASCHTGPNLTDERTHNTGVAWRDGTLEDHGAGRGDFKTPTLREVEHTAPYMHDGSLSTLEDVIEFYDQGGRPSPHLDQQVQPLGLTLREKQELAAFLRSLSGEIQYGARTGRSAEHERRVPVTAPGWRTRAGG